MSQHILIIPFIMGAFVTAIEMNRIIQGYGSSGKFWPFIGGSLMGLSFIWAVML